MKFQAAAPRQRGLEGLSLLPWLVLGAKSVTSCLGTCPEGTSPMRAPTNTPRLGPTAQHAELGMGAAIFTQ